MTNILQFSRENITVSKIEKELLKCFLKYGPVRLIVDSCNINCSRKGITVSRINPRKPKYIPNFIWGWMNIGFDTVNGIPVEVGIWRNCVFYNSKIGIDSGALNLKS